MARVVGQVGCVTLIFIGAAFGAGLLLDNLLNLERRYFTIAFLVGSVPIALFVVARLSFASVAKMQRDLEALAAEENDET